MRFRRRRHPNTVTPAGFREIQTGPGSGRLITLLPPPHRERSRFYRELSAPMRQLLHVCETHQTLQELVPSGYLIAGVFARSVINARGICVLVEQSHGIPARGLARALLEDVFIARWMLLRPQEALERMTWHERAVDLANARRAEKLDLPDGFVPVVPLDDFTDDDVKRIETMFGRHLNQGLSGLSSYELMQLAKEGLDPAQTNDFEQAWRVGLSLSNALLHTTSDSIAHPNALDLGWSKHVRTRGGYEGDALIALSITGWSMLRLVDILQASCSTHWDVIEMDKAYAAVTELAGCW